MACLHPIWIKNRRYFDRKRPRSGFRADDDHRSALALRPWDVARQYIMVPCGKCEECLRKARNDWFIRLDRERMRCKREFHQVVFITITIAPKYYEMALQSPSAFIRKWNERIRHSIGHSFKHAFFQEFGCHPETGSEPRLHFHGFLFGVDVMYHQIRKAVGDLGFVWIAKATAARTRYVVKYVTKGIYCDSDLTGKTVTINGQSVELSTLLQRRVYTRKFVSPGVGDYLGDRPAPSSSVTSWDYSDFKTGIIYSYSIPRYYDRYLSDKDQIIRAVRSADTYARICGSDLVKRIVALCVEKFLPHSALSYRSRYAWVGQQVRKFLASGKLPKYSDPPFLDDEILSFWRDNYQLQIT